MDKVIAFGNKTEGRDKFTKAIQYSAKLIAWILSDIDKNNYKKFYDLWSKNKFLNYLVMARDSRKIFRLFKSIQEIKNINDKFKDLLWKSDKTPIVLEIMSRIFYLVYWIMDNLVLLSSIKIVNSNKIKIFSKIAHFGWTIGICWGLLKHLYELLKLITNLNKNQSENEIVNSENEKEIHYSLTNLHFTTYHNNKKNEFLKILIEIVGKIGDLIPATSGCDLDYKIIGYNFSDGMVGVGGLLSAIVSMWSIWDKF